jgi:hypothetical protein
MKPYLVVTYLGIGLFVGQQALAQELFIYPKEGQTAEQQAQDKFECHGWSVEQSGFDPSNPQASAPPPPPPTTDPNAGAPQGQVVGGAARGAAGGAAIGAIAGDAGKGAAIGAVAGAMRGGGRRRQEKQAQQNAAAQAEQQAAMDQQAAIDQNHANYNRAMKTCLEARNYTVN